MIAVVPQPPGGDLALTDVIAVCPHENRDRWHRAQGVTARGSDGTVFDVTWLCVCANCARLPIEEVRWAEARRVIPGAA